MIALKIIEIKNFMGQLLLHEVFDNFLVSEVEVATANTFKVNGRLSKEWFDEEEREQIGDREYAKWSELKNIIYQIGRAHV